MDTCLPDAAAPVPQPQARLIDWALLPTPGAHSMTPARAAFVHRWAAVEYAHSAALPHFPLQACGHRLVPPCAVSADAVYVHNTQKRIRNGSKQARRRHSYQPKGSVTTVGTADSTAAAFLSFIQSVQHGQPQRPPHLSVRIRSMDPSSELSSREPSASLSAAGHRAGRWAPQLPGPSPSHLLPQRPAGCVNAGPHAKGSSKSAGGASRHAAPARVLCNELPFVSKSPSQPAPLALSRRGRARSVMFREPHADPASRSSSLRASTPLEVTRAASMPCSPLQYMHTSALATGGRSVLRQRRADALAPGLHGAQDTIDALRYIRRWHAAQEGCARSAPAAPQEKSVERRKSSAAGGACDRRRDVARQSQPGDTRSPIQDLPKITPSMSAALVRCALRWVWQDGCRSHARTAACQDQLRADACRRCCEAIGSRSTWHGGAHRAEDTPNMHEYPHADSRSDLLAEAGGMHLPCLLTSWPGTDMLPSVPAQPPACTADKPRRLRTRRLTAARSTPGGRVATTCSGQRSQPLSDSGLNAIHARISHRVNEAPSFGAVCGACGMHDGRFTTPGVLSVPEQPRGSWSRGADAALSVRTCFGRWPWQHNMQQAALPGTSRSWWGKLRRHTRQRRASAAGTARIMPAATAAHAGLLWEEMKHELRDAWPTCKIGSFIAAHDPE
eukprot:jgi/Ulvmu1/8681/UM047_0021.1